MRAALAAPAPPAVACIVGPEGGWSTEERAAAVKAGCVLASLGQMTLRADAVGLVAVSIVNFAFDGSVSCSASKNHSPRSTQRTQNQFTCLLRTRRPCDEKL